MLREGVDAVCYLQQQAGSCQMVALPHQAADKQVAVEEVEGGEQGGGGGAAAPLQLGAHLEQLIARHLQAGQPPTGTRACIEHIRARMCTAGGNHRYKCSALGMGWHAARCGLPHHCLSAVESLLPVKAAGAAAQARNGW